MTQEDHWNEYNPKNDSLVSTITIISETRIGSARVLLIKSLQIKNRPNKKDLINSLHFASHPRINGLTEWIISFDRIDAVIESLGYACEDQIKQALVWSWHQVPTGQGILLRDPINTMDLRLIEFLARCEEEEREAVDRWFNEFQPIALETIGTMKVARGTSISSDYSRKEK